MSGRTLFAQSADTLGTTRDAILLPDGTLWSHAATLGTRTKGGAFTIGRETITNFAKVFASVPGYRKVPIDYEHGSVNGATDAGQPVPKAGDLLEVRGVFEVGDFSGELRASAEKLVALAGRPLHDPRNFGLWVRWKPTPRALAFIHAGEITEMSIAFGDDLPNNVTGEGEGPGLVSIALTILPFLDDMVPVAASRTSPARPSTSTEDNMPDTPQQPVRLLAAVGALVGSAVASEDEAVTALGKHSPEVVRLRVADHALGVIGTLVGQSEPAQIAESVKTLAADVARLTKEKADADGARIKALADQTLARFEKRIGSKKLEAQLHKALTAELAAGVAIEKTETLATLESMPPALARASVEDKAEADGMDRDAKVYARAQEIMRTDDEIKELAKSNRSRALDRALDVAERELATH